MEIKKYRIGTHSKEYELRENCIGWIPEDQDWKSLRFNHVNNVALIIANPINNKKKSLFLHYFILKDAFPFSFFGEKRSEKWFNFAIVSDNKSSGKFIIPV
jgi:hypothetical protein